MQKLKDKIELVKGMTPTKGTHNKAVIETYSYVIGLIERLEKEEKQELPIDKLARLCLKRIEDEGKTLTKILKRKEANPFVSVLGKTNLGSLIYRRKLSFSLQVKLSKFFELSYKLILK